MSSAVANDRRLALHLKRKRINILALSLSLSAMAFGLFWLIWILFNTIVLGISGMSIAIFTEMTPAPNVVGGGLANAIYGSLMMVGLADRRARRRLPWRVWPAHRAG